MSNSSLATYRKISPNRTSPRNHKIDTITIHCYVGQITCERAGEGFADPKRNASCNYVVDKDGRIGLIVEEKDKSWCSSSSSNDHRAITIEVASDSTAPYAVNAKAYEALIRLCADICQRNDIKELKWKADKSLIGQTDKQNMTVHRWFANKACPGDWLYSRHGEIAEKVNEILSGGKNAQMVKDLYCQLLGRRAKSDEVKHWGTKDEMTIWKGIYNSQECQTLYIRRLYRELLGREGSAAEVQGWLAQMKTISRDAVYAGFINSMEYKNRKK